MKKILSIALILAIMIPLVACFSACAHSYKNDLDAAEVINSVKVSLNNFDDMQSLDAGQLLIRLDDEALADVVSDFQILYNSENYDEFAVLKADSNEAAKNVADKIKSHYFPMKESLMATYNPDLYAKIDGAVCEVYGQYVAYAILSQGEREDVMQAVKAELKK